MLESYLSYLIATIVTIYSLSLGLIVGFAFRNRKRPPLWLGITVLFMAVASGAFLFGIRNLSFGAAGSIVCGALFCWMMGFACVLRRVRSLSFPICLAAAVMVTLPFLLWVDLRFRVIVLDHEGRPVDVPERSISLHHPPESYFQAYESADGIGLEKGIIYFGFIRWVQHKERWAFPDMIGDKDGRLLTSLNWQPARWSEWPKVVIAKPTTF